MRVQTSHLLTTPQVEIDKVIHHYHYGAANKMGTVLVLFQFRIQVAYLRLSRLDIVQCV